MHRITPFFYEARLTYDKKFAMQILTQVTVELYNTAYFAVYILYNNEPVI